VIVRNLILLCSVWFVLASANVMAQEQTAVATPSTGTTAVETDDSAASSDLLVDEEEVNDTKPVEPPQGEDTESAGRFIPTEEISQDLGGSFPESGIFCSPQMRGS
jgi:hypothetical protein